MLSRLQARVDDTSGEAVITKQQSEHEKLMSDVLEQEDDVINAHRLQVTQRGPHACYQASSATVRVVTNADRGEYGDHPRGDETSIRH